MVNSDKWTNTLNWVDKHLTYVSVVKVDDGVTRYGFVEKDSIQKEVGTICDGFIVSVDKSFIDEHHSMFSHAVCLYDSESMETAIVSVLESPVEVPLPVILSALNLKDVKFH